MQGIGIDAVDIERFRKALERTPQLRNRLFTHDELQSVNAKSDPTSSLAARFAVREATMKALGVG
jgi:holo-[acyl-carrier protein] synthase